MERFIYNDGGRADAGYKGTTGDCVCRAIAIAANKSYQEVYDALANGNANQRKSKRSSKHTGIKTASKGINTKKKWFHDYMTSLGFKWIPTMEIGKGCKVHLKAEELPKGRLVVNVSKHFTAVIDGVINDTYDPSRGGTRCVYGYYILEVDVKKITVAYWHLRKFPDLKWEHLSQYNHSNKLRQEIIDECINKGYSVMIRPASKSKGYDYDGELIWIDNGRFGQK